MTNFPGKSKKVSEYNQKIPQSHTADQLQFFLFLVKDMCLFDIFYNVANPKGAREIIRQGPTFCQ